jgi:hypothetical protein
MVHIKWFYRPCEVPETVYQLLIQDRTAVDTQDKTTVDTTNGKRNIDGTDSSKFKLRISRIRTNNELEA